MVISIVGLDFCVPELIWTIITFFILMFLLKIFLYNPVLKILDERKAKVESGMEEGKRAEKALEETNAFLNAELCEQNNRAREIIGQAKAEAEKKKDDVLSEAHKEVEVLRESVRERINAEETSAKNDAEANMPDFVMMLTKKLLGTQDAECPHELVKNCIEQAKEN